MPSRPPPSTADNGREESALKRKLADLVAKRRYSEAIRVREQALRRRPDLDLQPSEAQLWCLEGRQAAEDGQGKRAEGALRKAMALGLAGEPHGALARLWLDQGKTDQALALLREAFEAGVLPPAFAGAYLKLLLLAGELDQARALIRDQPRRFQTHQLQWAAGAISLLEGDPANARRQFARMTGAATPGDHGAAWRAWACLEADDPSAAAAALKGVDHPACAAVALDLVARGGQHPAELLDLTRRDLPRRELVLALALVHHLRQHNLLSAAQLLLANERPLLSALPELVPLRRSLLLLAGQQALERDAPVEAIACWRPIVDRPSFDADLALRLYPLLDGGDDEDDFQEAERLASQLLGWVRRAARDNPSAWPEPLLSTTLARLLCWQADQHMRLGARQQARRCMEQARQLAPESPDVVGREGMLVFLSGDIAAAIPPLWQALDGGCRSPHVYEVLTEALELTGQKEERMRLRQRHGANFEDGPLPELDRDGEVPAWLEALSQPDVATLARAVRTSPERDAPLEVLRIFVEHVSLPSSASDGAKPEGKPGKVSLAVPAASDRWDALLSPLDPADQVEPLTAMLVAIHRFCRRVGKPITSQIARRQEQLEQLAAEPGTAHGERALRALLLLHGLRLKRAETPGPEITRLLRRAHQPERALPLALLDLRLLASTKPWRAIVEDLRRQDPQQPLLTLALATMERTGFMAYIQLSQEAFEQARRQQDSLALAACRRERGWAEAHPEQPRGRPMRWLGDLKWDGIYDVPDFASILRAIVRDQGMGEISDADLEKVMPDIEPLARRAISQIAGQEMDEDTFPAGREERQPPPHQRGRGPRRTFMDL